MHYYELALVLDPQLEEEALTKRVQRYVDLLTQRGATDIRLDRRGLRKLAYNIKGKDGAWRTQADYSFIVYQGPGTIVAPVEADLRLDEDVIRYMTVRYDQVPPVGGEVEQAVAAVARAGAEPGEEGPDLRKGLADDDDSKTKEE